ncbi:MAG: ImmA/IrrE family metallo-endopeptidase [Methyloprofundus sp.]|nr:ImmA/IrrE family metallo-endopeptidase [Methyloprofundus sp.]
MIYTDRQYEITSKQVESISSAMKELPSLEVMDWLQLAQRSALESQISDLEAQLTEYSLIRDGKVRFEENVSLSSLPEALIQARISKGFTQDDLAEILNLPPLQVQKYESSGYMGVSLSRLAEIAKVTGVLIQGSWEGRNSVEGDSIFIWEDESNIQWSKFPIKEMLKRGWFNVKDKLLEVEALKEYFKYAAGSQYATALHRKKFHGENTPNEYALLAWQARVLEKARQVALEHKVPEFEYNDSWVKDLVTLSVRENAPVEAQKLLASKGIILIIEEHLQGTYLDGAAMLLDTGHPVIALTLRHDRLDNFWFVLMHELGHVFMHLFDSLNMDFFDEESHEGDDKLENEADRYALNNLVKPEAWEVCLSRFFMTSESVLIDARNLGVHPSIIAGRIRKERNNYTILTDLVGQGIVRSMFGESR